MSSSCVIIPKVAKLDSLCLNGNGGSQNTSKDCRFLRLTHRVKLSKGGKVPSQEKKKLSTSISISCSPTKAKYISLQNEKLEEYKKGEGEPIKTNRPKIKKQKRSSSWRRKKKKKKKDKG